MSTASSRTAFITGASSGIGAAFARSLAAKGYNLVLVARREGRLRTLAEEIEGRFAVRAEVRPADLSSPDQVARLGAEVAALGDLEILVNNAGFGLPAKFFDTEENSILQMIQVHVTAPVRLCRAALSGMLGRRRGAIINVSSVAAFAAMPRTVTYSATKAFLNLFSEGLRQELKGTGVRVQALCPGLTRTEFHTRPGFEEYQKRIPGFLWMTAEDVVRESLDALDKDRALCIPGSTNRWIAAALRSRLGALAVQAVAARFRE
jgi:hypothetical protein